MTVAVGLSAVAFSTLQPLVVGAVVLGAIVLIAVVPQSGRAIATIAGVLALGIALLNPFVQANGDLVLLELPSIPVFDTQITYEEVLAGLMLGLRAGAVTAIIRCVLLLADADRLTQMVGRLTPRSALMAAVGGRMVPTLRRDATAMADTARLRGRPLSDGPWRMRVRTAAGLAVPVVGSALERSLDVAESMAARGYGAGPPTRRPRQPWIRRDVMVAVSAVMLVCAAVLTLGGWVPGMDFYPTPDPMLTAEAVSVAGIIVGAVAVLGVGVRE